VLEAREVELPAFSAFSAVGFERLPERWRLATSGARNLRLVDFLAEILLACAVQDADPLWLDEAAAQYEKAICAQAVPIDGAQEILGWAKGQDYQIGLLSNTMFSGSAHIADLERFNLDKYFDAMLYSADAEKWKPSPAPYLSLAGQLQTIPAKTVFIGDDPLNDIVGGQAAGMRTVLIRSSERFKLPKHVHPDAMINHLGELPAVLARWTREIQIER
jgi:HAD superfamily hydrolase (TIGR01549 family)